MMREMAALRGLVVDHHRFAIRDLDVPQVAVMRDILKTLQAHANGVSYLHCWGGVGRTGTAAGCLLAETGFTATEALALIARKWQSVSKRAAHPRSPETGAQIQYIRTWKGY